jgi:hypothetical protein
MELVFGNWPLLDWVGTGLFLMEYSKMLLLLVCKDNL